MRFKIVWECNVKEQRRSNPMQKSEINIIKKLNKRKMEKVGPTCINIRAVSFPPPPLQNFSVSYCEICLLVSWVRLKFDHSPLFSSFLRTLLYVNLFLWIAHRNRRRRTIMTTRTRKQGRTRKRRTRPPLSWRSTCTVTNAHQKSSNAYTLSEVP